MSKSFRSRFALGALLISGFALTCGYQACGSASFSPLPLTSSANLVLAAASPVPGSNTAATPAPVLFHAGDPVDPSKLICVPQGGLAAGLVKYQILPGIKALALAANCKGFISYFYDIADQAEANRMALEACQIAAGNQPCVVVAEGNTFKYDADKLVAAASMPLTLGLGGATLDVANVPFVTAKMRSQISSYYVGVSTYPYKAFAIYPNGAVGMGFSNQSQAEADKSALERCQGFARLQTCMLYARGATVVYGQTSLAWQPAATTINFNQSTFDATKLPFIDDYDRATIAGANVAGQGMTLYISPLGGWGYAATAQAAEGSCNNPAIKYLDPCVLYSVGTVVKLKSDQIGALGYAPVTPL